jgi:hypothetical protein
LHIILSIAEISEYDPTNIKINPNIGGMLIITELKSKTFPTNLFFLSLSFLMNNISRIIEIRIGR